MSEQPKLSDPDVVALCMKIVAAQKTEIAEI